MKINLLNTIESKHPPQFFWQINPKTYLLLDNNQPPKSDPVIDNPWPMTPVHVVTSLAETPRSTRKRGNMPTAPCSPETNMREINTVGLYVWYIRKAIKMRPGTRRKNSAPQSKNAVSADIKHSRYIHFKNLVAKQNQ